jgi:calcineurin-like phosphoesterase family protein
MLKVVNFTKPFWIISDTHFFHSRLAFDFGLRTEFKSIEEMNETIFNNWNNTVKPDDYLFFLGDFVVGAEQKYKTAQILYDSLNGKKIFLQGNHDEHLGKYTNIPVINGPMGVLYKDKRILFNHEPMWNFDKKQWDYHIFGHIHNNSENSRIDKTCMKNVSVEMINYTPVFIDDVIQEMEKQRLI